MLRHFSAPNLTESNCCPLRLVPSVKRIASLIFMMRDKLRLNRESNNYNSVFVRFAETAGGIYSQHATCCTRGSILSSRRLREQRDAAGPTRPELFWHAHVAGIGKELRHQRLSRGTKRYGGGWVVALRQRGIREPCRRDPHAAESASG